MNDWPSDLKTFVLWLVTGAMSFITWLGHRQLKRLDLLEANYVSKSDFEKRLKEMSVDRERMHAENQRKLDSIEEGVTGTHKRMDDLYRDLIRGDGR